MIESLVIIGSLAGLVALVGAFWLAGWLIKKAQAEDRSCSGESDTGSGWYGCESDTGSGWPGD
jgi:hypothetical protein